MPAQFSVQNFKAAIGDGGLRPNQFMVNIYPSALVFDNPAPQAISLLVSTASLPGVTNNPTIVQYRGREVKFAGDQVFAPWTTTFLNDTAMVGRRMVESWMNIIESRLLKIGVTTPDLYYGTIDATQLDKNGAAIRTYRFTDAFPIDMSDVGLDYGANDTVSTFTCTWAYQQFTIIAGQNNPVAVSTI